MAIGLGTFQNNSHLGSDVLDQNTYINVQRLLFDFIKGTLFIDVRFPRQRLTVQFDTIANIGWDVASNTVGLIVLGGDNEGVWGAFVGPANMGPGLDTGLFLKSESVVKIDFDFGRGTVELERDIGGRRAQYQLDNLTSIIFNSPTQELSLQKL